VGRVLVGTSGYSYDDWRGRFYPQGLSKRIWLSFYARQFETVEINASFYRNFSREVFAKWRQETGDTFAFAIKGPRRITHVKRLKTVQEDLKAFFAAASGLEEKLAVVLWQFPGSFKFNPQTVARLRDFLALLPTEICAACEFRDTSWFAAEVYDLLREYRTGWVINDSSQFPSQEIVTGDPVYIRFHGPGALYASAYSIDELNAWAAKIIQYRCSHEVCCYFNNDVNGYAVENALQLRGLLTRSA
jgi:uncharacterized protein YecE (DUF72 family)